MPKPIIDVDECTGCGVCVDVCSSGILELDTDVVLVANEDDCDGCASCVEECPMESISIDEAD